MKEHKIRQQMFHTLEIPDDYFNAPVFLRNHHSDSELVNEIVEYFTIPVDILKYPSKSYAVAIIYSKLLEIHFGENFYDSLDDLGLLFENDVFFVPYHQAKHIYDAVLEQIPLDFNTNLPQIQTTIDYFRKEFYLAENPYFNSIRTDK